MTIVRARRSVKLNMTVSGHSGSAGFLNFHNLSMSERQQNSIRL